MVGGGLGAQMSGEKSREADQDGSFLKGGAVILCCASQGALPKVRGREARETIHRLCASLMLGYSTLLHGSPDLTEHKAPWLFPLPPPARSFLSPARLSTGRQGRAPTPVLPLYRGVCSNYWATNTTQPPCKDVWQTRGM